MSEAPGPRTLNEFVESLKDAPGVDPQIGSLVAHLHEGGRLTSAALISALRDMRQQENDDAATTAD